MWAFEKECAVVESRACVPPHGFGAAWIPARTGGGLEAFGVPAERHNSKFRDSVSRAVSRAFRMVVDARF